MSKLRAGVIGLGVGMQHALGLVEHIDCALTALCDFSSQRLAEAGTRFPGVRLFSRAEDLIEAPDLDLIVVASNDDYHAAQILRAIEAGRHVFAEKPLTTDPRDTEAIRAALQKKPSIQLSSNTILRMSPRFTGLKADISAGTLGTVFSIEGDYNYGRLHKLTEGWRGDIPRYSVMLGGGIHVADLMLWLAPSRPVEVFAMGNGISTAGTRFQGNDLVVALVRFEDGVIGKLAANFGCVHPHFHRFLVYGSKATFENGQDYATLWQSRATDEAPARVATAYPGVPKHALLGNFVECLLGRASPVVTAEDVFNSIALCHAIDHSIASGRPQAVHRSQA